ncbi:hypothetical protein AB0O91_14815 [Kitasatospora sp. NPDC089797]|uniref:hypothetical protein n=1 Tax=Kitasatospora sp. NPDC089797 TaxID=3155298 RepID=UPI00344033F1
MNVHELLPRLPEPDVLRARCRALALLDIMLAEISPRYGYQSNWRPGVDLATMEDGSGDQYGIVFDPAGVLLYGFCYESEASWTRPRPHRPGLLDGLPAGLAHYPADPELQSDGFFEATLCAWREVGASAWQCGPVVFTEGESDGAGQLFGVLANGSAEAVSRDAEDFHGRPVDRDAVAAILSGSPLPRWTVAALEPALDFEASAAFARKIGHPVAESAADRR